MAGLGELRLPSRTVIGLSLSHLEKSLNKFRGEDSDYGNWTSKLVKFEQIKSMNMNTLAASIILVDSVSGVINKYIWDSEIAETVIVKLNGLLKNKPLTSELRLKIMADLVRYIEAITPYFPDYT